jgi:hypothetical protein
MSRCPTSRSSGPELALLAPAAECERWAGRNAVIGRRGGGRTQRACLSRTRDPVIVQKPKGAVSEGDASGVDGFASVNLLELKAWVAGVLAEQPVRLPSGFLDLRRKLTIRRPETRRRARFHSLSGSSSVARPAARSARASAASLLRASCEFANCRAHSSSSPSSSSSHQAIRSCSSAGNSESFAMAASSARVMACSIQSGPTRPNFTLHQTGARGARPRSPSVSVMPHHRRNQP